MSRNTYDHVLFVVVFLILLFLNAENVGVQNTPKLYEQTGLKYTDQ